MTLKAQTVGLLMAAGMGLQGCAVIRVADTAVDATVFAGTTVVRGAAVTGRVVTGTTRQRCDDGERRQVCEP